MDRRVEKTKHAIRCAYFELLNERNDKRITVAEITRRANIDRKTFYLHYGSCEDIIKEFSEEKVDEMIRRVVEQGFPMEMIGEKVFEVFNSMIKDNLEYLKCLSGSHAYDYFFEQIKMLCVKRLLDAAKDAKEYSQTDIKIYAEFMISGIVASYVRWIRENEPCPIEELAKKVEKITFGGLKEILNQGL